MADLLSALLGGAGFQSGIQNYSAGYNAYDANRNANLELQNQNQFYQAQDQLANSDPFKSNPFLQMMTRQMSPKLSPSDAALRGLAYGQAMPNDPQGLAKQFQPVSMFGMTPSNMGLFYMNEGIQQGMSPEQARDYGYRKANLVNKPPMYDQPSGSYIMPSDIMQNQNPVAQANAPKQQASTIQNSAGLPPVNVNQPQQIEGMTPQGIDMPIESQQPQYTSDPTIVSGATGLTRLQVKNLQNYDPVKLQEEIQGSSDEAAQIEQNLPQLAEVRKALMSDSTNTGALEPFKNLLTGAVEDIFGKGAIDPTSKDSLLNQGLIDFLGTKQGLQGMVTYFVGKGAVSDAEGKKLSKLGVALGDNEFKNIFVGISSELLSEARLQKLQAKQEYIEKAGSPVAPLVTQDGKVEAKNWQDYYNKNYKASLPPFTIGFAQKVGDSVDLSRPLTETEKVLVRNGAFDITTGDPKSKGEQELRNIAKNTEGLVLKTDKGYYKIMNGQAYELNVGGQ